jgi:LPXTG-motif cell wall-anchored protein
MEGVLMRNQKKALSLALAVVMGVTLLFPMVAAANPALMPAKGNLIIHKYLFDEDDMYISDDDERAVDRVGPTNNGYVVPGYDDPSMDEWKLNGIFFNIYKVDVPLNADGNAVGMPIGADPDNPRGATYVQAVSGSPGAWVIDDKNPTHVLTNGIAYPVTLVTTIETGDDAEFGKGIARANGLDRGFYLVIEKPDTRVISPIDPFLVSVPMTNITGDGWLTDVHVYPKNEDIGVKKILDKSVVETGHIVTWTVITGIPSDIGAFTKFNMFDELDHALTYVPGSMKIRTVTTNEYDPRTDARIPDWPGTDFSSGDSGPLNTVAVINKTIAPGDYPSRDALDLPTGNLPNVLEVVFSAAGRTELQNRFDKTPRERYVAFTFQTTVDAKHIDDVGRTLDNEATFEFTNRYGNDTDRTTNDPDVHTAALVIEKHDSKNVNDGSAMNGAKFKIAMSLEDAKANPPKYMRKDPATGKVLYPTGDTAAAWTAAGAANDWEVTVSGGTATNPAHAIFAGLIDYDEDYYTGSDSPGTEDPIDIATRRYRTYYLIETLAPPGYNLLKEPIAVSFTADNSKYDTSKTGDPDAGATYRSYGTAFTIYARVANTKGFILPLTGGMGTVLVTAGGVVLIALAAYLLVVGKRKKEAVDQA